MKKEISQNLYILPSILCILQFCFLFLALFNSGYYFANKVLSISFGILVFWILLFFISLRKTHNFYINTQNIFLLILFILISLYCIKMVWFSHYLSIGAISDYFKGQTFIDPLYHSTLAQSIVTNGYPSIMQNAPVFLFYHSFSHFIISFFSILLSLPCFIVYNYIFPVLTLPLFLYLIQKTSVLSKGFFRGKQRLNAIDYFIIAGIICTFASKKFLDKIGFCNYSYILSESCLISIILLFVYLLVINHGYKRIKTFNLINLSIIIPLFIFILSFSKISTGCIFLVGVCFFLFRKNKVLSFNSLFIIFYLCLFGCYYFMSERFPASYPFDHSNNNNLIFFHYILNNTKNLLYGFIHYFFFFLPITIIIISNTKKKLFIINRPCEDNYTIFIEMIIILAIASCLPGIIMQVDGGSSFYFCIPVYFLIWLVFVGTDTATKFSILLQKRNNKAIVLFLYKSNMKYRIELLIFVLFFLYVPLNLCREAGIKGFYSILKETVASRIDPTHFRKEYKYKISELFLPVKTISDKNYLMFNEINLITQKARKDYCTFISGNSIINRYDYYNRKRKNNNRFLYGNLAITAYLGIPVINSIYVKDDIFYRGDMLKIGKYEEIAGYSMPPITCGERVTKDNMMEVAKKIGKKKIIILYNNSYEILNVQ